MPIEFSTEEERLEVHLAQEDCFYSRNKKLGADLMEEKGRYLFQVTGLMPG